jgi:hypothetical protein
MENITYDVTLGYWKSASSRMGKEKFRTKIKEINGHFTILIINVLLVTIAVRVTKSDIWISHARQEVYTEFLRENALENSQEYGRLSF